MPVIETERTPSDEVAGTDSANGASDDRGKTEKGLWLRLAVGIAIVFAAAALRLEFLQSLGTRNVFLTFFPAVMLASLYGGLWAGLLATTLSAGLAEYLWLAPPGSSTKTPADWTSLAAFVLSCALISLIVEAMHRTLVRANEAKMQARIASARQGDQGALRESRERLRVTLTSVGDAVMTADSNGRITFLNPVAEALTGWKAEEALNQPIQSVFQIINEQTRVPAEHIIRRVMEEGHVVEVGYDTALVTKDGREVPIEDSAVPILDDGKVIGMVLVFHDVTERRRAEQEVFETQQRLKALLDALPVGVNFSDDATCQRIWGNPAAQAQFEVGPEDNISASAPDDRAPGRQAKFFREGRQIGDSELPVQRAVAENRAIPPFELEVQLPNGRKWFAEASGAPIHDRKGNVIGGVAVTVDITERKRYAEQKLAQQVLERLSGKLIEAQETERRRIARELHDDICQRLALLSMEFDQTVQAAEAPPRQVERRRAERRGSEIARLGRLQQASQHCSEIGRAVQALSHEIHSFTLDHLGIVTAARSFCREFSEKHRLAVEFTSANVPNSIPQDVSLCLFRIVQEAVRNAAKHSGVSSMQVSMGGAPDGIELEVRDGGVGFDPKDVAAHGGLGLISMRERVNLVGGTFSIESKPTGGTKIKVRISLKQDKAAAD